MPTLDSIISNYFVPLLPGKWHLPFNYRKYCADKAVEVELLHLEKLTTRHRVAVDVGATQGLYSYKMSHHFREVYSFEVNPELTVYLRKYSGNNIHIINEGLSSQ